MKQSRPLNRVRKHKKDGNNVKGGFVTGNIRYKRSKPGRAMGKARAAV